MRDFIAFLGHYAEALDPRFTSEDLYTDKSLFKAQGPVWHQSDRKEGRVPEKLRHLDTDASWSKSGYHGWVYGYGLHLVDNRVGFPKLVQVETATVSEKVVIDHQAEQIITDFGPDGKAIAKDCNSCHTILYQGTAISPTTLNAAGVPFHHPEDIGEAWKEMNCSDCHTGQ